MKLKERIEQLLAPLDQIALECDGFCRCASFVLTRAGIDHVVWTGSATFNGKALPPSIHCWIRADELWIDYRLKMWLGPEAPHGVHDAQPVGMEYTGAPALDFRADSTMYQILTGKMP